MEGLSNKILKRVLVFVLALSMIFQSVAGTTFVKAAGNVYIEITGYQMNMVRNAFRTVYSVVDTDKQVSELGLIYALADYATYDDMYVGSTKETVYSYAATSQGRVGVNYSGINNAQTYVMTMLNIHSVEYYTAKIMVKAYAKLSDGTCAYSQPHTTSVFEVAESLYKNSRMTSKEQHDSLYDNILSFVDPSYEEVEYNNKGSYFEPEQNTTTEQITTKDSQYTDATINDWSYAGNWGCYFGAWDVGSASGAYRLGENDSYQLRIDTATPGTDWLIQASYEAAVVAGHTYRVTASVTSDQDGSIGIKEDISNNSEQPVYTDIKQNATIEMIAVYTVNSDRIKIMFELGRNIAPGTTLTFNSVMIEDITEITSDSVETTKADTGRPSAPTGLVYAGNAGLPYYFAWSGAENTTYNFYIDGNLIASGISGGAFDAVDYAYLFTAGTHVIGVTAVTSGGESEMTTIEFKVDGATETEPEQTTKSEEITTQEVTTKEPETTTHKMVEPGVQSEAPDSGVASNVSLMDYFDGIDTVLSSTQGNTEGNEGIDKLFDRNTSTKFFTGDAPAITIAWKMKRAVILKNYTFVLASDAAQYTHRDPHSWAVYGSLDGENWTTISDIDNGGITHVNRGEYTFNCTVQTPCQYFMLIIENSGDDGKLYYGSQMSEIYLNGDVCRITESIGKDITNQVKEIRAGDTTVTGFNANEGVENLFDSDNSTKLYSTSGTPCSIVWTMNQKSTLYSYTLTTANDNATYKNRTVKSWELYGSSDGSSWTLIDTVTDSGMMDVNYADYTYLVDKIGEYKHYKLTITDKYGTGFQLAGITLRGNSVIESEYKALFVGDWDKVTAPGYQQALYDAFYDVYPRQYTRWGIGTEPKKIFVTADKGYDGVAYTMGSSIVISVDWMNNNPTGIGYFTHELTHAAQQYGNVSSSGPAWWVENMANYGGFRYYHWTTPQTAQVYYANDTSLQNWNYEAYGNNKWFFSYMDSRYPTTKDSGGNVTYGLIDALNHLLKDNKDTRYDDNPYDTSTPWNQTVKRITGYDCIESLRLHYVDELKNGTWTFTGFKNYADNWITENLPGVPNIDYPEYVGKKHGNITNAKLPSAVTSGTNLMSGATVIGTSGYVNASEAASMLIDGDLSTKWCATSGSVENAEFALEGAQHFVKIDLGSTKTFNTYTLYNTTSREGFGNTTEWEVLISNDGKNWTSVDYQVGMNDSVSSYGIGTQTARYITFKVFNADNGGGGTVRLYELQLYNR